jgi:hypothetical protein
MEGEMIEGWLPARPIITVDKWKQKNAVNLQEK